MSTTSVTSIDPSLLVHNTAIGSSNGSYISNTIRGAGKGWHDHVILPRITKVTNGYTVEIDGDAFIAENVEAVTGIISAQLLKLGAK